ncbi:MAG: RagB/SusD family nutrient uptake outer membrane protein [Bacteroidales bacterium]|jgi:hypothetical protein|nr:RagB/SusD family nutrient uptake outer membrane protein [Bacteroidales bacterium]
MNQIKNIKSIFIIALTGALMACNESKWLEEKPFDFYTPGNSYTTTAQFKQSINLLYDNVRNLYFHDSGTGFRIPLQDQGDLYHWPWGYPEADYNNYSAFITSTYSQVQLLWNLCYVGINNANQILYQLEQPNQVSDADKATMRGEALFFRAFLYRTLGHVYGGVPLQLDPVSTPKRDFVRSSRAETYDRCRIDLEEAITLLQDVDKVKDGVASKQAAQHLLAEIYICLEQWQKAIDAATAVISRPDMALMTARFGSRANEPGDVYWDLFRVNNQNRSKGNTEAIMVLQYDFQNSGSSYSNCAPRHFIPQYRSVNVEATNGGTVLGFTTFTAEKGGRGNGYCRPTHFMSHEIWGADFDNDIRNSEYNIVRDQKIDNPAAKGFGQWIVKDGWLRDVDTLDKFYPFLMKVVRVNNFPETSYAKNSDGSPQLTALGEHGLLNSGEAAHASFRDEYLFRLAETYLLRAEAYLGNNQKDRAAADINTVRTRAHATTTPADGSEIDIDYILDERGRELYAEEYRNITLFRLGKFVERSKKYCPTGYYTGDHQNLWPIPFGEIEKNILAEIKQNPGYESMN